MASNPYVNKVELADGTTLIDISDTTAQAKDVLQGEVFYTASGARSVGTALTGVQDVEVDGTSVVNGNGVAEIDLTGKADVSAIPTKTSDLINDSDFMSGMFIASYGSSTYAEVLSAYQKNHIIYCKAASGSNPAAANKLRMAFLAYVNNMATPTEFEFQYYRSMSSHSNNEQGDEVHIYKLNSSSGWSYIVRKTYTKIAVGAGLTATWANGTLTISLAE